LVQEELKSQEQDLWRHRLVHLLNVVFPAHTDRTEPALWETSERLLPHVMTCTADISLHLQDQDLADVMRKAADYLFDRSQHDLAESLYRRALQIQEQVSGPEHPKVATVLSSLVRLYLRMGNYGLAESLVHSAVRILEQTFGPEHLAVASPLSLLARV